MGGVGRRGDYGLTERGGRDRLWRRFCRARMKEEPFKEAIRGLLRSIGEDPERKGLLRTPERLLESLRFLTSGYGADIGELVGDAIFEEDYSEIICLRDIEIFSLCEHHILPFYGKCHVAYVPDGRVVGLSKIPRIVDAFARRLQIQERLTVQIAECLREILRPLGVAVVMEAFHLCMAMRGVEKQHAFAVTSSMLGVFRKDERTRLEFLSLIGKK